MITRVKGSNVHGNKNEEEMVKAINGKKYEDLGLNLRAFIDYISKEKSISVTNETMLKAEIVKNNNLKQDLTISIDSKIYNISMKMGTGNSVHQESCEDFVKYIEEELSANIEVSDNWRYFLWRDKTLDGSGSMEKDSRGYIKSRLIAREFKKEYPKIIESLKDFIIKNEEKLIQRFLFEGRYNSKVDFVYHGTPLNGAWVSKEKIIDHQLNSERSKNTCLPVGQMSIQAWNISRRGKEDTERKRGALQVKYAKMEEDFNNLMTMETKNIGTLQGNREEFNITRVLNRNKQNSMWRKLLSSKNSYDNYYAVQVDSHQFSELSGKKVRTKSDAYIIEASLSKDFLLEREHILKEEDLIYIKSYEIIKDSGISIKMKDSKKYTILKLTKDSFLKAFKDIGSEGIYVFAAIMMYSMKSSIEINEDIISNLGLDYDETINYFKEKTNYVGKDMGKQFFDEVRNWGQEVVRNEIESNFILKESIFTGKHWFKDPYYASYLYANGDIESIKFDKYNITTGSGRSKGKYSVIIKPL